MFHKANLISICLSFYPFIKRLSIIRYSKKLQNIQSVNINYYQLLFSFYQDFNSEQDFSPYYDYYCFKFPSIPTKIIKELFLSFLEEKSLSNPITINSASSISNDILNQVQCNIHLVINTYHFLFDEAYTLMQYDNIAQISFEFTTINQALIETLIQRIINHNITSLKISIIYECAFKDLIFLFTSIHQLNLQLKSLSITITEGKIESVNKTLNIIEDYDTIGDEITINPSPQVLNYDFLFEFIASLPELETLELKMCIPSESTEKTNFSFTNLKNLRNITLQQCSNFPFSELINILNPIADQIKNLSLDYAFQDIDPKKFENFPNLEQLEISEYVRDSCDYPSKCDYVNFKRYSENKESQYYRIRLLEQNKTIKSIVYKNISKQDTKNQSELVEIINSMKFLKEIKIECICNNIDDCYCKYLSNENVEELNLSVNHEISQIIKNFPNVKHIKGISDEDSLFLLPYAHIESIGIKGDCKSPFIIRTPKVFIKFENLSLLSLAYVKIEAAEYEIFTKAFATLSNLQSLSLFRFTVKDIKKPLISLFDKFRYLNKMKSLSVHSCNLNEEELIVLCQQFKYLPMLNSLSFNQCCKYSSPFFIFEEYIQELCNIRYISFQHKSYISNYEANASKFKNCILNCYEE